MSASGSSSLTDYTNGPNDRKKWIVLGGASVVIVLALLVTLGLQLGEQDAAEQAAASNPVPVTTLPPRTPDPNDREPTLSADVACGLILSTMASALESLENEPASVSNTDAVLRKIEENARLYAENSAPASVYAISRQQRVSDSLQRLASALLGFRASAQRGEADRFFYANRDAAQEAIQDVYNACAS